MELCFAKAQVNLKEWLLEHEELFDNELKELYDNDLCEICHLLTIKEKYKKVLDKVKE